MCLYNIQLQVACSPPNSIMWFTSIFFFENSTIHCQQRSLLLERICYHCLGFHSCFSSKDTLPSISSASRSYQTWLVPSLLPHCCLMADGMPAIPLWSLIIFNGTVWPFPYYELNTPVL